MILATVPYDHAKLSIKCVVHDNPIEYLADEDALGILDRLQLTCPGLAMAIRELHKLSETVEASAMKECGEEWKRRHQDEVKKYPSGWMPRHFTFDDFPLRHQERLKQLDGQLEALADECVSSWVVTLEDKA
jgi:hypothetical protein